MIAEWLIDNAGLVVCNGAILLASFLACRWFARQTDEVRAERDVANDLLADERLRCADLRRDLAAATVRAKVNAAAVEDQRETIARLRFQLDHGAAPNPPVTVQLQLPESEAHVPYEKWPLCVCGAPRRHHAGGSHGARPVGGCGRTKCVRYEPRPEAT